MALESLAPELLAMVMSSFDSFLDLYALISVSPRCFRIFCHTSLTVLSAVLGNELGPEVLHHALAVLHAPSTPRLPSTWCYTLKSLPSPPTPDSETRKSYKATAQRFLEAYFRYSPLPLPTRQEDIVALIRRHRQVTRFVDAYCKRAFDSMKSRPNTEHDSNSAPSCAESLPIGRQPAYLPPAPLSPEERQRLQRAFYRLELFYRVFPPQLEGWNRFLVSTEDKSGMFVSQMAPWEVEEISSTYIYLTSTIADFLDDFEDHLVQTVLSSPGVIVPVADETCPTEQPSPDSDLVLFTEIELYGMELFSRGVMETTYVQGFLVSHGLEWLDRFIQADFSKRMRMMRLQRLSPIMEPTYASAVERTRYLEWNAARQIGPHYIATRDQILENRVHRNQANQYELLSRPAPGFARFKRKEEDIYFSFWNGEYEHYLLRRRGYSFWDSDRLANPLVEQALLEAQTLPSETIQYAFKRSARRKSVEVRLEGVLMPHAVRAILHQYGAYLDSDSEEDDD